ncbi:peptidase M16 [Clostridia bacterium]|nr:peptidase M16 [Clostridia bacterium]
MFEKTVLSGGTRFWTEKLPHVRSAAFGIWVGAGSRHEAPRFAGASHALEHMVFKGTHSRTAAQIAEAMDGMGGQLNAFTTKECTCFYGRALDNHLTEALDLVCDIFFNPLLDEADWATERGVIMEEIDMYEDTPEDLVSERLFSAIFKGSPLAKPILGNKRSLGKLSAADLRDYRDSRYGDVTVSLAGMFGDEHINYICEKFAGVKSSDSAVDAPVAYTPSKVAKRKPIEQNHWCFAFPALAAGDADRHVLQVLNGILGGGMSSRLFQAIREKAGLCYEVSSFVAPHRDVGTWGIYMALNRDAEASALPMVTGILRELAEHGPTDREVDRTREQLKSSAVMGLESTQNRMNHMGQSDLLVGEVLTVDEMMERCDAVSREDCRKMAEKLLDFDKMSFSTVGRVDTVEKYSELLEDK